MMILARQKNPKSFLFKILRNQKKKEIFFRILDPFEPICLGHTILSNDQYIGLAVLQIDSINNRTE